VHNTLLKKRFVVSTDNRFLVPARAYDTIYMIKSNSFFESAIIDHHQRCFFIVSVP
jgi:hypothetical protein